MTARSAFACEPLLISLAALAEDGLLDPRSDFVPVDVDPHRLDFPLVQAHREPLLRAACAEFLSAGGAGQLEAFVRSNAWLEPYARFAALRDLSKEPWWLWPNRYHDPVAVPAAAGTRFGR